MTEHETSGWTCQGCGASDPFDCDDECAEWAEAMTTSRPADISGSTLCTQQPCEWYTSDPSGVCQGHRRTSLAKNRLCHDQHALVGPFARCPGNICLASQAS